MSKTVSIGGLFIALGAACASYSHYMTHDHAAIFEALGALLAASGRSIMDSRSDKDDNS